MLWLIGNVNEIDHSYVPLSAQNMTSIGSLDYGRCGCDGNFNNDVIGFTHTKLDVDDLTPSC